MVLSPKKNGSGLYVGFEKGEFASGLRLVLELHFIQTPNPIGRRICVHRNNSGDDSSMSG